VKRRGRIYRLSVQPLKQATGPEHIVAQIDLEPLAADGNQVQVADQCYVGGGSQALTISQILINLGKIRSVPMTVFSTSNLSARCRSRRKPSSTSSL
jgi:hypothetical protein